MKTLGARAHVHAYITALPPDARRAMKKLREAIRAAAPQAEDHFSYRIPAIRIGDKTIVWYAAFTRHTSLFPMTDAIRRTYARDLEGLKTSKGTIQFPLDAQPSAALVRKLVRARVAEVRARGK